jgi:hypothetical protein
MSNVNAKAITKTLNHKLKQDKLETFKNLPIDDKLMISKNLLA